MGGMFCWVKLALVSLAHSKPKAREEDLTFLPSHSVEKHYRFKANEAGETNTNELMQELFGASGFSRHLPP